MTTLTNPQRRALALLSAHEWKSAEAIDEKPRTLKALVRRGLVKVQLRSDDDGYGTNVNWFEYRKIAAQARPKCNPTPRYIHKK